MEKSGWRYYNHSLYPTGAPDIVPDLNILNDRDTWKRNEGKVILASWTDCWDCEKETEWWHVIKDTPFDISGLKSKRRYEINKGKKNFSVKKINPLDFFDKMYEITLAAYSSWPEKYRPDVTRDDFKSTVEKWENEERVILGGFRVNPGEENDGSLCSYAQIIECENCAKFDMLRVIPEYEKLGINAAMVAGLLEYYGNRFENGFFIDDGARSVRHETKFQDYLQKNFGFRKVYCRLNIKYSPLFAFLVKIAYPFRNLIPNGSHLGSLISGMLKMEEIRRSFEKKKKAD